MGGELVLFGKPAFSRATILKALAGTTPLSDRRIGKACFIVTTGSRMAGYGSGTFVILLFVTIIIVFVRG